MMPFPDLTLSKLHQHWRYFSTYSSTAFNFSGSKITMESEIQIKYLDMVAFYGKRKTLHT